MNNKIILKLFIKFLRKENIYKDYIEGLKRGASYRANCSRIRECDELEWLVKTVKSCPQNLIVDAFSWGSSKIVHWGELDLKWKGFVYNKSHK